MTLEIGPRSERALLVLIVALFCIRNLPWTLDDFDQAKQAYTSFEMVTEGHWWFQHTPAQRIATKPPVAGWLSAATHALTGSWDLAWRLPSFAAAVGILLLLRHEGKREASHLGAMLASAAFGLNLLTPRLATLVRTDMLLTLCIFLPGLLIWRKVDSGLPWTRRERWAVFALITVAIMTKGPIVYAFLLPGLAAFRLVCKRKRRPFNAWSGWWSWFAPLVPFIAWAGVGAWRDPAFHNEVVVREFLGRFTIGEHAVHHNQPLWFYVLHLLHKFAPWSVLLLLAPAASRSLRRQLTDNLPMLWLLCWAVGGLVFMSFVPSKRVDRIFPVVPPFCLLLASMARVLGSGAFPHFRLQAWAAGATVFALVFSGGYTVSRVVSEYRHHEDALVRFGAEARSMAAKEGWRLELVQPAESGLDEGMLLYLRKVRALKKDKALEAWLGGEIDALAIENRTLRQMETALAPFEVLLASERRGDGRTYDFIKKPAQ